MGPPWAHMEPEPKSALALAALQAPVTLFSHSIDLALVSVTLVAGNGQ